MSFSDCAEMLSEVQSEERLLRSERKVTVPQYTMLALSSLKHKSRPCFVFHFV